MNESETKIIIERNYYFEIFNAITNYLQENPEAFWYKEDYWSPYWYELGLIDYKIDDLYPRMDQGKPLMEIMVEASIELFDIQESSLGCRMTEKIRIVANVDFEYENFEVVYVERYRNRF